MIAQFTKNNPFNFLSDLAKVVSGDFNKATPQAEMMLYEQPRDPENGLNFFDKNLNEKTVIRKNS